MALKRLFFDIETSPNIGLFWQPGHEISVGYESIIKERGIICCSYKWSGDSKPQTVHWTRKSQDDTRVVERMADLIAEADEVVTHNGDRFDITWIRGRALRIGKPFPPRLVSYDTCAISRRLFNLNSHRLDYLSQYLGIGGKLPTGYDLWKRVLLHKDNKALDQMIAYCERDVVLLEKVFERIKPYVVARSHVSGECRECPECGKEKLTVRGYRTTESGARSVKLWCSACGKWTSMPEGRWKKANK